MPFFEFISNIWPEAVCVQNQEELLTIYKDEKLLKDNMKNYLQESWPIFYKNIMVFKEALEKGNLQNKNGVVFNFAQSLRSPGCYPLQKGKKISSQLIT